MGVDDGVKLPALPFQNLADLSAGILVISAVNETDLGIVYFKNTYFSRTINIEASGSRLDQLIHDVTSLHSQHYILCITFFALHNQGYIFSVGFQHKLAL